MREYDQMLDAAKLARTYAAVMFVAALAVSISAFFSDSRDARFGATVALLLSAHLMTGYFALKRMASMQAALDMKRISLDASRGEPLVTERSPVHPGDVYNLRARDGTRFEVETNRPVVLTVRYLG